MQRLCCPFVVSFPPPPPIFFAKCRRFGAANSDSFVWLCDVSMPRHPSQHNCTSRNNDHQAEARAARSVLRAFAPPLRYLSNTLTKHAICQPYVSCSRSTVTDQCYAIDTAQRLPTRSRFNFRSDPFGSQGGQ